MTENPGLIASIAVGDFYCFALFSVLVVNELVPDALVPDALATLGDFSVAEFAEFAVAVSNISFVTAW